MLKNRQLIFFQNSWYSLIASFKSFNLIPGFRYLCFKPGRATSLGLQTPLKVYGNLKTRVRHKWSTYVLCRRNALLVAIAPIKRSVNTRAHVRAPFQGSKIKRPTNSKIKVKARARQSAQSSLPSKCSTGRHCTNKKRSVNTRAHVRAPFQGTKIKRGTGTSNSYFQNNSFSKSFPLMQTRTCFSFGPN